MAALHTQGRKLSVKDRQPLSDADGVDCCCEPTEACCLMDGSCQELTPKECLAAFGSPQGRGTTCAGVECPQTGACCLPDGSCVDDGLAEDCTALNGAFFPGANCPVPCIAPTACPGAGVCPDLLSVSAGWTCDFRPGVHQYFACSTTGGMTATVQRIAPNVWHALQAADGTDLVGSISNEQNFCDGDFLIGVTEVHIRCVPDNGGFAWQVDVHGNIVGDGLAQGCNFGPIGGGGFGLALLYFRRPAFPMPCTIFGTYFWDSRLGPGFDPELWGIGTGCSVS